jgi:hypothetical protein
VAQVVEGLLYKHEALSSNPSPTHKTINQKKKKNKELAVSFWQSKDSLYHSA